MTAHGSLHGLHNTGQSNRLNELTNAFEGILSKEARTFVETLVAIFASRIEALLLARQARQALFHDGRGFDFYPETKGIRESNWQVHPLPSDLLERRVEITGPVDRKMVINALNSGANMFMADFEDSNSPTWSNVIGGQVNLYDAIRRTIRFEAPGAKGSKIYQLNEKTATLLVRPRGLHLKEQHWIVDEKPIPGALVDFGLYFFHNAKELLQRGTGPYFYLPKLEHYLEARLWNDIFNFSQDQLSIPRGTIKATVLIETLPAAFQMDEILYELKEHSAGLNCGRWDYIFSFIKKRASDRNAILPDRAQVTMDKGFLRAYTQLLIQTCHKRNVHAMGGMAAQIPIKDNPAANEAALAKVRADKLREVLDGHDGTWVAHPGLVPIAREVFDAHMKGANQIERKREDVHVSREDLLQIAPGTQTEAGLRHNIRVGIQYIEAWLRGQGCVPIYNLMEDAATAEISRAQVWQWLRHSQPIDGLGVLSTTAFLDIVEQEMLAIEQEVGQERMAVGQFAKAKELFTTLSVSTDFEEFLTIPAYQILADSPEFSG